MNNDTTLRADMKRAIKYTSTEIRTLRASARTLFVEARALRAAGDLDGSTTATSAAWKARGLAARLSDTSRGLLLAYAFLRGRPLAALERTRSRAPAPTAEQVLGAIASVQPDGDARNFCLGVTAWLAVEASPGVPASPASIEASAPLAEVA